KVNDQWRLQGAGAGPPVNPAAMDALLRSLVTLRIAGVLPKPPGLTSMLGGETGRAAIAAEERTDLARKGFYLTPDGQLVSNQGEIVVRTNRGVFYTLRFGDLAPGSEAPAAASDSPSAARENRYLFIMVNFDGRSADSPALAGEGGERARLLRARF